MGSTWTSAGELLQAPGAAEVRKLMKGYAQAAQAHDITNPYFALKGGVDHGLCLISIKLESAIFFDFNGAASITTSGVYLRKGDYAIEGVAFTHMVQLTPNGPEFIAIEEAESTLLSPWEFLQRRHPCSLSSSGSQQASFDMTVQAPDNTSMEAWGCRSPSPAVSAITPLPQDDFSGPGESEACQEDVPGPQPDVLPLQASDNPSLESSGCRTPSPAFSATTPLPQDNTSQPEKSEGCQKDVLRPQPAVPHSVSLQASDNVSVEASGPSSTSPAVTAVKPLPKRRKAGKRRAKAKARQEDVPGPQPAVPPSMSTQAPDNVPVEASGCKSSSPAITAGKPLPQRRISRRRKSKGGQRDVPAPQPAVPRMSTQAFDNTSVESSGVKSSSPAVSADTPLPQQDISRQEKSEAGPKRDTQRGQRRRHERGRRPRKEGPRMQQTC